MTWPFDPLRPFSFDLIVADPPWWYELRSSKGNAKSAERHYRLMPDDEILRLRVGDLVGMHSWLLLWVTAPRLDFGMDCMKRWGFTYVSTMAWHKTTKNDKTAMGTGYICRSMHENILIGRIGAPEYRKALPSLFRGQARGHSRKPDEFYRLVDRFALPKGRKLDLFSRQSREGWDHWGDEIGRFDGPEPAPALVDQRPQTEEESPPLLSFMEEAGGRDDG